MQGLKDQVLEPGWKDQAKSSIAALRSKLVKGNDTDEFGNYNELDEAEEGSGEPRKPTGKTYYTGLCICCNKCPCARCSKRYITSFLCSMGFLISFGIRCNTGVATSYLRGVANSSNAGASHLHAAATQAVAMAPYEESYLRYRNSTHRASAELQWSPLVVGAVESSFFWGYLFTQVPGGIIAAKLPATKIFGLAIFCSSFLNLFLPTACHVSFVLVIFIRVLQGLVEGATYPACHGIWRYWAPPLERSRLATIAFCGSYAGAVLGLFLSGLLSDWLGWPAPFYFYGVLGIAWFSVWWFNAFERPGLHPTISEEERVYIETSIGELSTQSDKSMRIPWRKFFTSMPVYAIIVANFARSWSFYLLITEQTKYFRDVHNYDMTESGVFSALPHLVMATIVPLGGQLADRLRKKLLTTTVVRKIFNCGGFGMEAIFLLGVGYSKESTSAIICLIIAVGFSGFAISGYNVNHLDIAPRYASILMGLSNGIGTFSGMLVPVVTVNLVRDRSQQSWSKVFLIASLIHFVGVIFYGVFASGEKQSWAEEAAEAGTDQTARKPPPPPVPPPPQVTKFSNGEPESAGGGDKSLDQNEFFTQNFHQPEFGTVPSYVQQPQQQGQYSY